MGKTSTASKQKYNDKAYDRVFIYKGLRDGIKSHVVYTGESMAEFISRAIQTQIEIDEQTAGFLHKPDTSDGE